MKHVLRLFPVVVYFLFSFENKLHSQSACPQVTIAPVPSICSGQCTNLTATVQGSVATTSYAVSNIAYTPYSYTGGNPVLVNIDDTWSSVVTMPFCFQFFGNTYTQFVIGSNALISFDITQAGAYCQWPINNAIPSNLNPMNSIMAPFHDIDPSVNTPTSATDINWQVYGTAPCRYMVVNWNDVAMFSCTSIIATSQLVLHETTNTIDIFIQNKPTCASWNGGAAIEGIQNATGTTAFWVAGRNFPTNWTATNDGKRFTPTGAPQYTLNWTGPSGSLGSANPISVCPTTNSTYTCTVTNTTCAGNVVVTATVPVTVTPGLTVTGSSTNATSCSACNGSATTTVTVGTGPFTYSWSPSGGTASTATNLCPGTYTCTVTGAGGCTGTQSFTITGVANPTSVQALTNVTCNGACNGTATITPSPVGVYTYNWLPSGGTAATASGLCPGTYTVTATNGSGCTTTQTITITQPTAVTNSVTSAGSIPCNGGTSAIGCCAGAGGTGPYTYAWTPAGGTGCTSTPLPVGTYTCTTTDANGCTTTTTATLTQPTALTATSVPVSTSCGGNTGSITVTPSGGTGPYTYSWAPSGGTTNVASSLATGSYTCTITDANGCSITNITSVTSSGGITASTTATVNITCNGAANGSATASPSGGTGPYTYAWSPSGGSAATATGLGPGTYTCTVTDANTCVAITTVTIIEPPALTISGTSTNIDCFGNANGTASVTVGGGTSGYTYNWLPSGGSSANATALASGTFTCNVTDANGCTTNQSLTITEPTQLTLAAAGFNITCFNACDGQLVVIPAGGTSGYTYAWSTGCTTASCNNICAGTYTIDVTDANGCLATATTTLTQPTAITIATSFTDAHCNQTDGAVGATGSGGSGTFTYNWPGIPSTLQNVTNVGVGTYSVIVTDANGCADTASVTVSNIAGVLASIASVTDISCNGVCDGAINANASGGTGGLTYSWSPSGGSAVNASALCAGNYTLTVTDAVGCTQTTSATITQPTALSVTATATPGAVCSGQTISIGGPASGGTSGYSYLWVPFGNTTANATITPTTTGPATLIVTDANGCMDSSVVNITVNANPVAILSGDSLSGCAPLCVNFSDLSTLSAGTITGWSWDFGDGNTSSSQNPQHCYSQAGPYTITLTVTTNGGCTNMITMPNYINVFANPIADFTAGPQPTTELDPMIFFTDASTNATNWLWTFGDTTNATSTLQNPTFAYPGSGCYNVLLTVTTPNGCLDTTTEVICIQPDVTLYVPNAFTPNEDGTNELFKPQGVGIDPEKFEMWIFDRWGNLIFYTTDFNKGWDGKVQGHSDLCQIDTYVWKIKAYDVNGHKHRLVGKVSLIR